ncbi:glycogen/starch/alpha-glucan phosphorylase [Yoonia sediminilitoris]|uniref:Alpha-1,4 glucan phosphorylase n=1 Tax=Yoonia sediminilitoris TaxID=1286148 RepID=A0A2T6KQZ4_9RHOB|nr:glycogen/starch/alpha-glucan phosphorylase [Yoonia sediminilitoris]PUB18974.1 starch phosphorylase [Yoonia sediminilitoris]RCW99142.1 starch phosphorylase [Yoonia sediminilitoris]
MRAQNNPATSAQDLQADILKHLNTSLGKDARHATLYDWRMSLSLALRDRVVGPWFDSTRKTYEGKHKRVYYLSMEFLIGRLIEDVTINLNLEEPAREAIAALGQDYDQVVKDEPDAALGNGGLGRLAACFMDSLSTLAIPAYGYGIRYEHGLFEQHFENGQQIETPEGWLTQRHAWEFERPEVSYHIHFGGHVSETDGKTVWHPAETIVASAYDTPTVGWQGKWANTLRLWAAKPIKLFDLEAFNRGDYVGANAPERLARTISRVLYPDDTTEVGKELRLKQEYFFTAASIKDVLRRFLSEGHDLKQLHDHVAIQLNDTHPAIAGPELVRILADEHGLDLDEAIEIARNCLGYTNHTLLPEALERWPEGLFARVLPRHFHIIAHIQDRHLAATGSDVRIIDHGNVNMGELAFVMAHRVNGVSALHSDLVKTTVFADLNKAYPNRIINQTNGVTPRRWLYSCNPALRGLINDTIGTGWQTDLGKLSDLNAHLGDAAFLEAYRHAKSDNKDRLAQWLKAKHDVTINTQAMFDIQIKRIHEYKRQHMNILETIALWNDIRDNPNGNWTPRVKIFGGKAAPGYMLAKSIIRLINDVATTINNDPVTRDLLQVVYPENYNVTMAEILIPASDLSEQISTAGKEASGTGNMKLSLNGSPTIGTLDGANVEIREHVGAENFFLFGLTADQAEATRNHHGYARRAIEASPRLSRVLGQIAEGVFSGGDRHRYSDILHNLYEHDYFLVTCDFDEYYDAQRQVDAAYADPTGWARMAAANTAGMGWFSSDRTIRGYADDIWSIKSVW